MKFIASHNYKFAKRKKNVKDHHQTANHVVFAGTEKGS
jgi:hypothetical protein